MGQHNRKTRKKGGMLKKFNADIKKATEINNTHFSQAPVNDDKSASSSIACKVGISSSICKPPTTSLAIATGVIAKPILVATNVSKVATATTTAIPIRTNRAKEMIQNASNSMPLPKPPSSPKPVEYLRSTRKTPIQPDPLRSTRKASLPKAPLPEAPLPKAPYPYEDPSKILTQIKSSLSKTKDGSILPPQPPKPKVSKYISYIKSILEEQILDSKLIIDYYNKQFILAEHNEDIIGKECVVNMKIFDNTIKEISFEWKFLNNCTPFLIAIKFGLIDVCKIMLANITETKQVKMLKHVDLFGDDALSICARFGYQSLCAYLIPIYKQHNIGLEGFEWPLAYNNARGNNYGKTPLIIAAEQGHMGIVELLLVNDANPLAKNDIGQSSLHYCVMKCCPTHTNYKTVFGNIMNNSDERYQYIKVHDDKYRDKTATWRFVRIIHLLLRFMIFKGGNISEGNYREGGVKAALESDMRSNNSNNKWDNTANNNNGAYTTFNSSNNSIWFSYFQLRTSGLSVGKKLTMEQSKALSQFIEHYRSPFIKKVNKSKLFSQETYKSGDYILNTTVFNSSTDKDSCPLISGDTNMFLELENGFKNDWSFSGSIDFIHYFLKSLFYKNMHLKDTTDNDKLQELLVESRRMYNAYTEPEKKRNLRSLTKSPGINTGSLLKSIS